MSNNKFSGERVFLHWPLADHNVDVLTTALGLTNVEDPLLEGRLPIEERFLISEARIALVSTYPFIFNDTDDLLGSDILKRRAVCVKIPTVGEETSAFNGKLDELGFLSLFIRELSDNAKLSQLLAQALRG